MSRKFSIKNTLFLIGIVLISLSFIMFIYAMSMFTARGNLSKLSVKISEICLVFWFPTLIIGVIIFILAAVLKNYKNKKKLEPISSSFYIVSIFAVKLSIKIMVQLKRKIYRYVF